MGSDRFRSAALCVRLTGSRLRSPQRGVGRPAADRGRETGQVTSVRSVLSLDVSRLLSW